MQLNTEYGALRLLIHCEALGAVQIIGIAAEIIIPSDAALHIPIAVDNSYEAAVRSYVQALIIIIADNFASFNRIDNKNGVMRFKAQIVADLNGIPCNAEFPFCAAENLGA